MTAPSDKSLWSNVPRIWHDSTPVALIGGGASLWNFDFKRLREFKTLRVIAINSAAASVPWADVLFYGDEEWPNQYPEHFSNFKGLRISTAETARQTAGVLYAHHRNRPFGILERSWPLTWNMSSGGCAITLAYALGSSRLLLLGYDMQSSHVPAGEGSIERSHFHRHYRHKTIEEAYQKFLLPWDSIANDAFRLGIEIVNGSPVSRLTQFPVLDPFDTLTAWEASPAVEEAIA